MLVDESKLAAKEFPDVLRLQPMDLPLFVHQLDERWFGDRVHGGHAVSVAGPESDFVGCIHDQISQAQKQGTDGCTPDQLVVV